MNPTPVNRQDGILLAHPRLVAVAAALAYTLALLWSYANVISPSFEYYKFIFHVHIPVLPIAGVAMAVLPVLWLPLTAFRPSSVTLWLIYLFVHVPSSVIPFCTFDVEPLRALPYVITLFGCCLLLAWMTRLPRHRLQRANLPAPLFWMLALGSVAAVVCVTVYYLGLHFKVHSFSEVYDVRAEYTEALSRTPRGLMYVMIWTANVASPFLFVEGLRRRHWLLLGGSIVVQIMLYSMTGLKSFILSYVLLGGLWAMLHISERKLGRNLLLASATMVVLCAGLDSVSGNGFFSSLFVRRLILTPGLFSAFYHDFFSANEKLYLSHSIFSGWFEYSYETTITYVIGQTYLGRPECGANVNFWADGFANFGYAGMIVYTLILGGVLWFVDCITHERQRVTAILLLAMPSMSLVNSALLTVLFTHGMGLAVFILWTMPQPDESRRRRQSFRPVLARQSP